MEIESREIEIIKLILEHKVMTVVLRQEKGLIK